MGWNLREQIESARNTAASFFLVAWTLDRLGIGADHTAQMDAHIPMDAHTADMSGLDSMHGSGGDMGGGGSDAGAGSF